MSMTYPFFKGPACSPSYLSYLSATRSFTRHGCPRQLVARGYRYRVVFIRLVRMRSIRGLPIDAGLREGRQLLVSCLLFVQRFLQEVSSVSVSHRAGPGHQGAVGSHLVV